MDYKFEKIDKLISFKVNDVVIATLNHRVKGWKIDPVIPVRQRAVLMRDIPVLYIMHLELIKIESIISTLGVMNMGHIDDIKVDNNHIDGDRIDKGSVINNEINENLVTNSKINETDESSITNETDESSVTNETDESSVTNEQISLEDL